MQYLLSKSIMIFCEFLNLMILIRVILTWVQYDPRNKWIIILFQLTDPILDPIKRLLRKYSVSFSNIDISPLIALIAIELVQRLLIYFIYIVF